MAGMARSSEGADRPALRRKTDYNDLRRRGGCVRHVPVESARFSMHPLAARLVRQLLSADVYSGAQTRSGVWQFWTVAKKTIWSRHSRQPLTAADEGSGLKLMQSAIRWGGPQRLGF